MEDLEGVGDLFFLVGSRGTAMSICPFVLGRKAFRNHGLMIMIRLFSSRARHRSVQKHACFEAA